MKKQAAADKFVLPETRALAALGCFDLLATMFLLATHRAMEANALMAHVMETSGPAGFVALKAILLGGPLALAEFARRHSPDFVRKALRIGLVVYIVLLLLAYRGPLLSLLGLTVR